jgi:hypothetical protein
MTQGSAGKDARPLMPKGNAITHLVPSVAQAYPGGRTPLDARMPHEPCLNPGLTMSNSALNYRLCTPRRRGWLPQNDPGVDPTVSFSTSSKWRTIFFLLRLDRPFLGVALTPKVNSHTLSIQHGRRRRETKAPGAQRAARSTNWGSRQL